MVKKHVTSKEVAATHRKVYSANYCTLQSLLRYKDPYGFSYGKFGHNCDVYSFGDIAIVTGPRPYGTPIDRDTIGHFEKRAQRINALALRHSEKRQLISTLIDKFIGALSD